MIMETAVWATSSFLVLAAIYTVYTFVKEHCSRGALIGGAFFTVLTAGWITANLLFPQFSFIFLAAFYGVTLFALLLLIFPTGKNIPGNKRAEERFDERDIMFARANYEKGTEIYDRYYEMKPELKTGDDFTREHFPGIGAPGSETYDQLNSNMANSMFGWVARVREYVDGPVAEERAEISPEDASLRLEGYAKYLGAVSAGTTRVNPENVYTNIGRGAGEWGSEIDSEEFKHALVFTIEMKEEMMRATPKQPVLVDSARQYLEGAKIAFVIAEYIRSLGYKARAHVDGNYRLILPPLAMDAGLGEVGRHSLLITPELGTRVRIGCVSTDLPLVQRERIAFGVQDFCDVCKKCQRNCPVKAIPEGDKENIRGTSYWVMHPNRCFRYWRSVGTDCGICNAVCPYSRPKGGIHSFVRFACKQSALSRRLFTKLDDLFYGEKPRSNKYPSWMLAGMSEEEKKRIGVH